MENSHDEDLGVGPSTVDVSEAVQFAESFPATDAAGKAATKKCLLPSSNDSN